MSPAPTTTGFRRRLNDGVLTIGAFTAIPDPAIGSILGRSGFDFVVIDAEHGPFTLTSLRACVEAIEATPAATVIRIAANDPVLIKQALDLGIDAVQVPNVATGEEAEAAVRASRYAPAGRRGMGFGRASGYGMEIERSIREADASTAVIAMIEDAEGVENATAIAASGVDGIFVGPLDLSASLGVPGETAHPTVVAGRERVVAAATQAGIAVGTVCAPEEAAALAAAGMRLLTTFMDSLGLAAAARVSARRSREGTG